MAQLRLFPPPGGVAKTLPEDRLVEASELLAEILAAVIDGKKRVCTEAEGETDE